MAWTFFLSLSILLAFPSFGFSEKIKELRLENGLTVLLLENRYNPLISATLFVKVGSKDEDKRINGISHLLEHLVFNGTKRRNQERIYEEQAQLGVFEHASTGKDATIFTFLVPREKIDGALDLLSDMLFNSVIPPENLAKEKKVVGEEIRRSRAMPGEQGARLLDEALFEGWPYALPVLGTEEAIERLSRQEILEYYRRYYTPDNMVSLFMGDFDLAWMEAKVRSTFGAKEASGKSPDNRKVGPPVIQARRVVRLKTKVAVPQINMAFIGPALGQADFPSFQLLAGVFNGKGPSSLSTRLKEVARPWVTDIASDVDIYQGFSRLTLTAFLAPNVTGEEVVAKIEGSLQELAGQGVSSGELEAAKNSFLTEWMRLREQFHYFAYFHVPYFVQGAVADLQSLPARVEATGLAELKAVARRYLAGAPFVAVILEPQTSQGSLPEKRRLSNGMTIIAEQNRDSGLAAFHLLVKGRAYLEPKEKPGMDEFLMRLLPLGRSNAMAELNTLGAKIKLVDAPFLPFDDYSKSRRYSELRLEVLAKYFPQALKLLATMVSEPSFEERDVEQVRQEMLSILKRLSQSPQAVAENAFYAELFGEHPFGLAYLGTLESISHITVKDLQDFHQSFLSPQNLILSVIADQEASRLLEQASAIFQSLPSAKPPERRFPRPEALEQDREVRQVLGAAQSYIFMGGLIPDISQGDELALAVGFSFLSQRLSAELRERRGLAYSVNASFYRGDGFGWFVISMGTRRQNLDEAKRLLRQEHEGWRNLTIGQADIEKISYSWLSRLLVRLMPGINRAYYTSLSEYQEGDPKAYRQLDNKLKDLSAKKVEEALKKRLRQSGILTVVVE